MIWAMATLTVTSQRLPSGTTVGAYTRGQAQRQHPVDGPSGSSIASAAVASNGVLTITDAGLVAGQPYYAAGISNGQWVYVQAFAV